MKFIIKILSIVTLCLSGIGLLAACGGGGGGDCAGATFYVAPEASGGTGSEALPFGSVHEAQAAAPVGKNICQIVTVYLQPGVYVENITLERGLQLIGNGDGVFIQGKIQNLSGHHLYIQKLTIRNAPSYGVLQRGGILEMTSVTVTGTLVDGNNTKTEPIDIASGTGVLVSGGANASLALVTLTNNQGQALAATDAGTQLKVSVASITGNRINELARTQFFTNDSHVGAVETRHGARLSMQLFTLEDNFGVGLAISHGAQAFIKSGVIRRTQEVNFTGESYAANARVGSMAELEIENVRLENSMLGVHASQGYMTMIGGQISDNEIGAGFAIADLKIIAPDYDPMQCLDNVSFINNGRVIDFENYSPVPGSGLSEPSPIPAAYCKRVAPL